MKTETEPFTPPVRLTPPDAYAAAVEAARAALDEVERKANIATADVGPARAHLRAVEQAHAAEVARRQKAAEEEAALKTATERAAPLHARADELREGIRTALAWVAGALAERYRLNSEIGRLFPDRRTTSHIRVLSDVEPEKGRGSETFRIHFELP